MKKITIIGTDLRSRDDLETTKRLSRNITEVVKKLEEQKNRSLTVVDIFTPTGEALRSKLRDYCERLIINDPINHVKKIEDLLWRKGFYDIISMAKKLRKGNSWNDKEKACLSTHLSVGVGFYHHFILLLQLEFDLQETNIIDFVYPDKKKSAYVEKGTTSSKVHSTEVKKCVLHCIHKSLICLGDLARYRLDIDDNWDPQIATRYYKMAIVLDAKYGMPHNQMGTMAGNKNYGLDAVYYYMRSLLCNEPFELAEGNLKRTIIIHSLNNKEKCPTQSCIARLFLLLQLWDNSSANINQINQESQTLLNDIENCLKTEKNDNFNYEAAQNQDSIENYLLSYKSKEMNNLTDDMVFKIIVICFMKIYKLQMKDCNEIHGMIAFVLAIFSQLLQFLVSRLQETLPDEFTSKVEAEDVEQNVNGTLETNGNGKIKKSKKKSLLTKLRRRRKRKNSSDSDGEETDDDSSSDDLNSDISENEEDLLSDTLSDEALSDYLSEDETSMNLDNSKNKKDSITSSKIEEKFVEESENDTVNGYLNLINSGTNDKNNSKEKKNHDPFVLLQVLNDEKLLISVKVCCDWLQGQQDIIKTCSRGSTTLFTRLVTLFNLINIDYQKLLDKRIKSLESFPCLKKIEDLTNVPLPEDVDLKDLKFFEDAQKKINWELLKNKKTNVLFTLIRIRRIIDFGHYLCTVQESGVVFDNVKNIFDLDVPKITENEQTDLKNLEIDQSKGKLMRHMGKLWLKAEVHALESRLHHRLMSPYLVPDHEAFSRFTPIIKHLVYSKKFIVIVPAIVICALDEMKSTSSQAREATRWLESQLQRGSRFLRAQRPNEKLAIPLMKGPKPKDKEAWLYFQIIECCHYFTQQSQNGDSEIPIVTLLTGIDDKKTLTVNPEGLAKSAGVNFEHIGAFHAKWKLSIKSHG